MDARFERYIENLRTVRTLSQPKFSPDMKAKELLETIQSNAIKCFDYMKENNAILNELVFQRAPAELTSAEIASLQEFADKMFNYASSEDCGIAYKVYSLLLENARIRGDKPSAVLAGAASGLLDAALNEMVVAAIRLDDVEIVLAPAGVNVRVAGVLLLFPFMVGFQRPRRVALVLLKSQNCVLCH